MAAISKKSVNPYRKGPAGGSSPLQNPMVLGGAALVLLFILFTLFSSGSEDKLSVGDTSGGAHKLRNPNNAEKSHEHSKAKENPVADKPDDIIVESSGKEEVKLQQDLVPDGGRNEEHEVVHVEPMEEYKFDNVKMYHKYTKGKSGVVIEDMLMAHAHAFHANAHYGGCCVPEGVSVARHAALLEALGLAEALPFACMKDDHDPNMTKKTIQKEKYHHDDTRIWTPAYVAYLKSLVKYPPKNENEFVIVAHVRRGDVTPCRPQNKGYDRYLPNKHFINVIEKYYRPGARVEIITESNSFEDLQEFRNKGYIVNLDEDLASIWRTFISADVVILSRSDFSMIPAVCAMGQVVYTPFWHLPIRGWDRVPKEIMDETNAEMERLRQLC